MAPSRAEDDQDDDPVTAEYDVYLTPALAEQVLLLQYPNRGRERPYNIRHGAAPDLMRIKPQSGHLEADVPLSTSHNFNKYQSLKWGDALNTAKEVQNESGTYGIAGGFAPMKPRVGGRVHLKDHADRLNQIQNDLAGDFHGAEAEDRVMKCQTLGGQILRHGVAQEGEMTMETNPIYFVGAFRENQLHLTKVDGTVQMRPQFHHIDAEDQRTRLAASRAAALDGEPKAPGDPRGLGTRQKRVEEESDKTKLENRLKKALMQAEEESWTKLEYVDEDMEEAYEKFRERMFVRDVQEASKLQSSMGNEEFVDAVSAPRRESPMRRRKRPPRRGADEEEDGEGEGEGEA
ncbi:hypothetical protein EJ03DRAFT_371688 [Teratosphaeria nubilosa]|uniref:DNA-directed RNA polymerase III subunit Rpc5 n=1 Tax=Teratosphaeria nubilosa TaxID=161662 RepID=A0A6G1LIP5_9PEZI|nr:hypothetical protein EJ03DRAFT_371688 [Teratosphaeria nubilosa]